MSGISSSLISPPRYRNLSPRPRSEDKRARIIDAAMRHFAEQGYHAARVGDIARLGHSQRLDFPAFRQQGWFVFRGLQESGAFVLSLFECAR